MRPNIQVVTDERRLAIYDKIGYNPNSLRFEEDHYYYFRFVL